MTLSQWADIALIFLLAQVFVMGIGLGIALFYTLRAMAIFDRQLHITLPRLRNRADRMALTVARVGEEIRAPLIATSSRLAQAQRVLHGAASALKGK